MSARSAPRSSRRSFLKFGALAAAGVLALRAPKLPSTTPGISSLRVASALPLPNFQFLTFPERLLEADRHDFDAALVPAYVAAQLIQKSWLQPLDGPTGRAHDPEGRYSVPFAYRVAALRFPEESTAPKAAAWDVLWSTAGGALWPAFGRVITGAALLRRGYSPNDSHPGHLIQAADDLKRLRPRIVPEVTQRDTDAQRAEKPLALVLADPADMGQANGLRLPASATMLIEYDWVITGGRGQAAAAWQFIDGLRPMAQSPRDDLPARLVPLMPLSPSTHAQHRDIWVSLTAQRA